MEPVGVKDSLRVERQAARASREYHERIRGSLPLREKRAALADFALACYKRLRIHPSPGAREAIESLREPDMLVLEMAHDGQLPHLGIVRLVLKTDDIARVDGHAVTLYLVGNHYSPSMRPDNIHFGMPLQGQSPDTVKHPPKVRIGKANAHKPFRWLLPPSVEDLARLRKQVDDFLVNNLAHERERLSREPDASKEVLRGRATRIFSLLDTAARDVRTFGDWLIRVQHDLFRLMIGDGADRVVFLPMADLVDLLREELATIGRSADALSSVKHEVSEEQKARGEESYQTKPEPSSFWMHCPACTRRQRAPWYPGSPVEFACAVCGHRQSLTDPEVWRWLLPDIVAYETAVFRLGIGGWVVGSRAPYHPVIERAYPRLFGISMPPKFLLTSVPTFWGLGDPPAGYPKTRLLRALLEMEPDAVAAALRAPWNDDPRLVSDLLRAS